MDEVFAESAVKKGKTNHLSFIAFLK